MEAAKNAVSSFLGQSGQHHTEVDEQVNPVVTSETVKPHRHEETTEAVDREVHQHHYHTTVQPVSQQETLPEQHTHNLAPQVEKVVHHGDVQQDQARNAQELGQFQDTSVTHDTTQSSAAAPTVVGEHVHHHVHEVVQPVIHKETIQPEVVHTTIPIHEKHIAPSEHHGLSTLPMKTMDEFKQMGSDLTVKHHSTHEYDGHPKAYNAEFQEVRKPVDIEPEKHDGTHDPVKTGHFDHLQQGAGTTSTSTEGTRGVDSTSGHGNSAAMGSGVAGVAAGAVAADLGRDHVRAGQNTDLDPKDTTGPIGDSGATTAGTALGGRTEGNTVAGASEALNNPNNDLAREATNTSTGGRRASRHEMEPTHDPNTTAASQSVPSTVTETRQPTAAETTPSRAVDADEPTNFEGGAAGAKSEISPEDNVQHASLIGDDPSLVKSKDVEKGGKLTGTGIDGSHSAVFGLTPDGHKYEDTKSALQNLTGSKKEGEKEAGVNESGAADGNSTSTGVGTGKVAEQMNDPRVAEKGHDGKASYGDSDGKPGAGA